MSQYPYQPMGYMPPGGFPGWPAPPAPKARSASVWQFVVGALVLLMGTCVGGICWVLIQNPKILADAQQQMSQTSLPPGFSLEQAIYAMLFSGVFLFALGVLLIVLGFFVRTGNKVAIVFSLIVMGLMSLFLLLSFVGTIRSTIAQKGTPQQMVGSLIFSGGALSLFGVTIARLISALSDDESRRYLTMQQAQQWMQPPPGYWQGYYPQAGQENYGAGYPSGYGSGAYPQQPGVSLPPGTSLPQAAPQQDVNPPAPPSEPPKQS